MTYERWSQLSTLFLISAVCFLFALLLGIQATRTDDARREACSYRCLQDTGRWPARVAWLGRDEQKRIKCECLSVEKPR